jgi:anti-sigma regulatory factor (Ser/Thr protein kinase)
MPVEDDAAAGPRKVSRYSLDPRVSAFPSLREFLRVTLRPFDPIGPYLYDIISATHEAAKNAVVHNPDSDLSVEVVCRVMPDSVVVEVNDRGSGFDARSLPPSRPEPEALAGRGMFIIYSLMDEVETRSGKAGTSVRMMKRFTPSPS